MTSQKTVVILQSNYIPWKGYFDLMNAADVFVLFDEVQFSRRDWRNRNKIIIQGQPRWLTIPVQSKGKYAAPVSEIEVTDGSWAQKHWTSIELAYGKSPFFRDYAPGLETTYGEAAKETHLSSINRLFLDHLATALGINVTFGRSDSVPRQSDDPAERLIEICRGYGATRYLSGPAAKSYIDPQLFVDAGIDLRYADYSGYPTYAQQSEDFEHGVSIIDMLMTLGPDTASHLKSQIPGGLFETPEKR
ncbi:hypothetical protein B7H23_07105 [Notoacmeibacter marinus]|uniref:WbqC family protein n=1 Tax=Notoacmeibacter marinus TaxID=1876515 RepID=A0A231V3D5_9HYPH|nr:WbqC family protein [Notoacmeibacter marinus]OXT02647.1 hypothetical protein B7H23_07105 [Notoacmeibacter marinus]